MSYSRGLCISHWTFHNMIRQHHITLKKCRHVDCLNERDWVYQKVSGRQHSGCCRSRSCPGFEAHLFMCQTSQCGINATFIVKVPDSKVHVGPRWAPCWPHGPCYQEYWNLSLRLHTIKGIEVVDHCTGGRAYTKQHTMHLVSKRSVEYQGTLFCAKPFITLANAHIWSIVLDKIS